MMQRVVILFFLLLANASFTQTSLNGGALVRNKQRVNYIYNFTEYITWSKLAGKTSFKIGVFGSDQEGLITEFNAAAVKKKIKNLPVEVVNITNLSQIDNIQILYIHQLSKVDLKQLLPKIGMKEILLVSENYPFHESMINFMEFKNELHFDVNEELINKGGLLVSPDLLRFSIKQQQDWEDIYTELELEQKRIEEQTNELEDLLNEINIQKLRVEAQRSQIKKQQFELNLQDGDISARKEELNQKLSEIDRQRTQLVLLEQKVITQNSETYKLNNTLDRQGDSIRKRKRELLAQQHRINEQEERIRGQREAINSQGEELNTQLEKMRAQGLLIYLFIGILLVILFLIFFAGREYKRKRRSEEEVRVQNQKLRALNESLDSFVYRVSHDLKAPVINVRNMITMLKEETDSNDDGLVPQIIHNLELSSNRLQTTITDLLELTKIEKVDEVRNQIRIKDVIQSILPEYEERLKEIGGEVELSFKDKGAYASYTEMTSVFQNLITNSIKYRRVDVPLRISISSKDQGKKMMLIYSDNGVGIDIEQYEEKLFSMFQRFTNDPSISGTGVGMYIIKRLIDKNNGTVKIESQVNNGLKYLIVLPSKMIK